MAVSTPRRLSFLCLPLIAVAWMAAPEWPARAAMLDAPWRDAMVPAAEAWAQTHPTHDDEKMVETAVAVETVAFKSSNAGAATTPPPAPGDRFTDTPLAASATATVPATDEANTPAVATAAVVKQTVADHGTVLMIGDSLMGEVAAGLRQNLPRRYQVVDRHKSSTGLTNVAYYDWPGTAQAQTVATHPSWVIVHMGANDAQDMLVNKHWIRFGSEDWKAHYLARAQDMLDRIKANAPGVVIVWVGLPAMRSPAFDAKMDVIRGVQQEAASSRHVPYLDGHTALGTAYSKDAETVQGRRTIMRAPDGIHYSRAGGEKLAHEAADASVLNFPWSAP